MDTPATARMQSMDKRISESSELDCAICLALPRKEIHQCSRGHIFCAECLQEHCLAKAPNPWCPTCRVPICADSPIRNRAAEFAIGEMTGICQHCNEGMRRAELESHEDSCEMRPAVCPAATDGCSWVGVQRDLECHSQSCVVAVCQRLVAPLKRRIATLEARLLCLQPIGPFPPVRTVCRDNTIPLQEDFEDEGDEDPPDFYTVGLPHLRLMDGSWYYEVSILDDLNDQPLQIGWANSAFTLPADQKLLSTPGTRGVGDCSNSWAFDGARMVFFHNSSNSPSLPSQGKLGPRRWKYGDVIGIGLEFYRHRTGGEMFCTVNGARCKGQDPRLDFAASDVANGLYPALSVGVPQSRRGGCLKVNFGERPFVYSFASRYGKDCTPIADALIVEDPY